MATPGALRPRIATGRKHGDAPKKQPVESAKRFPLTLLFVAVPPIRRSLPAEGTSPPARDNMDDFLMQWP